jgi:glycosyltransferase involved in cell wall biosynthesis
MPANKPLISCIMPVYNGAKYLREAMESILGQTCRDFEFLICNEYGSDDGSREIIEQYAARDSRIVFMQNDSPLGIAASLNRLLEAARGEYIARMDADDISGLRRFEVQKFYFDRFPAIGCFGINYAVLNSAYWKAQFHSDPQIVKAQTMFFTPLKHPTAMWRRNDLRYDPETRFGEDYELFQKMAELYDLSNIQDKSLFQYRIHKEQATTRELAVDHGVPIHVQIQILNLYRSEADGSLLYFRCGPRQFSGEAEAAALGRLEEMLRETNNSNLEVGAYRPYALSYALHQRWRKEMEFMESKYGGHWRVPQPLRTIYEESPFYTYRTYGEL